MQYSRILALIVAFTCTKELIKVRGKQVAPAELEGHLLAHPAIADVGVIGVPDDYSGEVPHAFIVLHQHLRTLGATDKKKEKEMRESIYNVCSILLGRYLSAMPADSPHVCST